VRAQQGERVRRIGVLMAYPETDPEGHALVAAFRDGLRKLGWLEGHNIQIEIRWATPDVALMQRFARELVALQPSLILAQNTPTTASVLQQTRSIPVIFATVSDPVGSGFIAGLAQPAGNTTGFIDMEALMSGKWLELLMEIAPRVVNVAFLFNPPTSPGGGSYFFGAFEAAAASFGLKAIKSPVHNAAELEVAVAAQAQESNSGLIVMPDAFLNVHRAELTALASKYRLPAVYPRRFYTQLGGLLSYGNDQFDNYRRAATYADRILRGTKPSDLPVQIPFKFDLVINLKTAKALDLDGPFLLQQRADEVIE
jgi:putative ABC transport system substrate-binding protein